MSPETNTEGSGWVAGCESLALLPITGTRSIEPLCSAPDCAEGRSGCEGDRENKLTSHMGLRSSCWQVDNAPRDLAENSEIIVSI